MNKFDVFLSYTKRRDIRRARSLRTYLTALGYSVWFDEDILNRKVSWVPTQKSVVIAALSEAIAMSRCTVLFAIEVALVRERPDLDVERAIEARQCMRDDHGHLIAWNWQLFEMRQSKELIAIYGKESWGSIASQLKGLGIRPSLPLIPQSSPVERFRRWVGRGRRIRRLFSALPDLPESDFEVATPEAMAEYYLRARFSCVFGNSPRLRPSTITAIVGLRGCGKSSLLLEALRNIAQKEALRIWYVDFPESDDVVSWQLHLSKNFQHSVIVIDDYVEKLAELTQMDQMRVKSALQAHASREAALIVIMTNEAAEDIIHARPGTPTDYRTYEAQIDDIGQGTVYKIPDPNNSFIERIVESHMRKAAQMRSVSWHLEEISSRRLVTYLREIPFFDRVQPPSYESLQGEVISNVTRCLEVLELAERQAVATSPKGSVVVDDNTITRALCLASGFSEVVFRDRMAQWEDFNASVARKLQQEGGIPDDIVRRLLGELESQFQSADLAFQFGESPPVVFVRTRAYRHLMATTTAEVLFGNRTAVLRVDYGLMDDQDLAGLYSTEALEWVHVAVGRFPWWVVIIDDIEKAPSRDQSKLRTLVNGDSGTGAFKHCVIFVDALPSFLKHVGVALD